MLLLSCGLSDEQVLDNALRSGDSVLCDRIAVVGLQTECRQAVAQQHAQRQHMDGAVEACAGIADDGWREECLFLMADEAGLLGAEALSHCEQAGRFQSQCVTHAAARDVEQRVFAAARPGQEQQAHDQALAVLRQYMSPEDARRMGRSLVVSWLAEREPGQPFSSRSCGNLRAVMCPEVYVRRALGGSMRGADDAPWRGLCGAPLRDAEQATQHGLPPWDASGAAMAAQGWTQLCAPLLR